MTLAQDVCPHHVIHASCAVVFLILFDSPSCTLHRLSHLPFILLIFIFIFHVGCFGEKNTVHFR